MKRFQQEAILRDLKKKMVFLSGPRQSGKTTLAKACGSSFKKVLYLNYDRLEDRKIIHGESWLPDIELLILDEIHKMPGWKNHLKGIYDTKNDNLKILVTGSARLELFNRVGDSLAGRFFHHRLLPLSPAECNNIGVSEPLAKFITRGGFPEPFLADNDLDAMRWRQQYSESLLSVDVLDFDNIYNLKQFRLVFELLRKRVGSPISYTSIAEDVAISPHTVKKYIEVLEALYIVFRVTPFSKNIARSLLKEPKIYFFDTGLVLGDNGARLENLVALCLLKQNFALNDYEAKNYSLHYLKTKEGKEVDFALVLDDQIEQLIEVKASHSNIDPNLRYFTEKYQFSPSVQIVENLKRERSDNGIEVLSAENYLKSLYL